MPGSDDVVRRSQVTPDASRIACRLAARWTGEAEPSSPAAAALGAIRRRRLGRPAVVEQQLVERHVELGRRSRTAC